LYGGSGKTSGPFRESKKEEGKPCGMTGGFPDYRNFGNPEIAHILTAFIGRYVTRLL
jgi:hypothetical protein